MVFPSFKNEIEKLAQGFDLVVGCDEVGVGPTAGPVVAAACILDPASIGKSRSKNKWYYRVRDSKTVNEEEREILAKKVQDNCLAYGIGIVWPEEIDQINIHHASRKAMQLAVNDMLGKIGQTGKSRIFILVDGRFEIPNLSLEGFTIKQGCIVSGDSSILSISAASIIAKVKRDAIMRELDKEFPGYGFGKHKGYGTREHQAAVRHLGLSAVHRRSFVKQA